MEPLATPAELAHLHLLINHFPTVGTILGIGLFLMAYIRKNDHLKKVSFEVFFLIALVTIPVYMTGQAASEVFKKDSGISAAAITIHQNAALVAFALMQIMGGFAWLALWQIRRLSKPSGWTLSILAALSVVTLAVMAWAANLGGDIHHPEILAAQQGTASTSGAATMIASFVIQNRWVWPTAETLHFLGMSLMFGVLTIVNLRLLGFMKGMSFPSVHRLLPFGILGFGVNLVTGMLFFVGAPEQYTQNVAFHWKVILLELAGLNYLFLTVFDGAWDLAPGQDPPLTDKLLAASALVLSIGVMYFGRMLPFIGNSF
jgi:uncharacterized membrane protein